MPMKVMVTGNDGYIGTALVPLLKEEGHEVVGVDTGFLDGCSLGPPPVPVDRAIRKDIRDLETDELEGVDAVIHLAALSNDHLGRLGSRLTYEINHRASIRMAQLAKRAGVGRFLYSSSCSVYGAAGPAEALDETAEPHPVGPYGESKWLAERDLSRFADHDFCPVYLRGATAYGFSPHLRADLVVNSLTGWAFLTGKVRIQSDGSPWRPLVHVEDLARAFVAMLTPPRAKVGNEAFNVGRIEANYQVGGIAELVRQSVRGSDLEYADGAGPDERSYRVDFAKIHRVVPEFRPRWTLEEGIEQLARAFKDHRLEFDDFEGPKFLRLKRIQSLTHQELLDRNLRWIPQHAHA